MKRIITLSMTLLLAWQTQAQLTAEQRIEDSVIGWYKILIYDHLKPQTTPSGKKKEADLNSLVSWVMKSYIPIGGLGTTSRYIGTNNYGVNLGIWNVSHNKPWTDAKGNFRPIPEEVTPFFIKANVLTGAWSIDFMRSPEAEYFAMQPDGYNDNDQLYEDKKGSDPRIDPNCSKFITWRNEWETVYLAPNNKLPLVPVSKGELLDVAERSLVNVQKANRKYVEEHWPNNKKSQDESYAIMDKGVEQYRSNIQVLRQRYKSSLNEQAIVRHLQPNFRSFQLDPDIFKIDPVRGYLKHAYPIYKIEGATTVKMKGDQPQWICVAFPFKTKNDGNQEYEMYRAMAQNLNYEYIYNYFYDPEKIKGKSYVPSNEAQLNARVESYRKKTAENNNAKAVTANLPANVLFKDEFATSSIGSDPRNWYFRKTGTHHTVSTVKGEQGNWLRLGYNNQTWPSLFPGPLPENCTMEFDLVTDPFNGRSGGTLELYLSTYPKREDGTENVGGAATGSTVTITFTSGTDESMRAASNFYGQLMVKVSAKPEVNIENHVNGLVFKTPLNQFTNKNTKIHVGIKLKDGNMKILVNNKEMANTNSFKMIYGGDCKNCNVLKGARFNVIKMQNMTTSWGESYGDKNVGVYVSNFKITKD